VFCDATYHCSGPGHDVDSENIILFGEEMFPLIEIVAALTIGFRCKFNLAAYLMYFILPVYSCNSSSWFYQTSIFLPAACYTWPCGEMASRLTTIWKSNQEIAGSTPVSVICFFIDLFFFSRKLHSAIDPTSNMRLCISARQL
jgi:hypothetical protein